MDERRPRHRDEPDGRIHFVPLAKQFEPTYRPSPWRKLPAEVRFQLVRLRDELADRLHDRMDDWRRERVLKRTIKREIARPIQTENRPEQWMHDRDLRVIYKDLKREIEAQGGQILVRRDELWLKREVGKRCVEVRDSHGKLTPEDRRRIADEFHLKVVDNRIMLPDLQIWVQSKDGERYLANVEVASGNYHGKLVQQKRRAGFHVVRGGGVRGKRPRLEPDVVHRIVFGR